MGNTTEARTIYILLTRSGTWFSRLIHLATADSYTHASIGLDGPYGPLQLCPEILPLCPPGRWWRNKSVRSSGQEAARSPAAL